MAVNTNRRRIRVQILVFSALEADSWMSLLTRFALWSAWNTLQQTRQPGRVRGTDIAERWVVGSVGQFGALDALVLVCETRVAFGTALRDAYAGAGVVSESLRTETGACLRESVGVGTGETVEF